MVDREVVIIGAGVAGLSTGILLLKDGYKVHVVAKDLPPNTTSNIAAAFWMPYLSNPQNKVMKWARDTHTYLRDHVMDDEQSGCVVRDVIELYRNKASGPDWADAVESWERPKPEELPPGYIDGHKAEAVLMDTTYYMDWLVKQYKTLGGTIEQREIMNIDMLFEECAIIVNCTGLGSRDLFDDQKVYPVRGQVVRVKPNGFKDVIADDTDPNEMTVIIPRINDIVLGGTVQPNDWNLEIDPKDTEGILQRVASFYPEFSRVEIINQAVGLRPARDEVRLELEKRGNGVIVHNYGHGGSGFTLSWGCAQDVVKLVESID